MTDLQHDEFMRAALDEARQALLAGEIPVGAVVVRGAEIIARAHNRRERDMDPTAHAELIALRAAARRLGDWRLGGCSLYVTLEPCAMCAGAIAQARLESVYFGAYDAKQGCCGSVYRLAEDPAFDGNTPCIGGVLEAECADLLKRFFSGRRGLAAL